MRVSVAVPVYNEETALPELLRRLRAVLDGVPGGPHEILLVDDGSVDGSWKLMEAAAAEDSRVVVLSLSRNFGHQAALTAALDHVTGDATVIMDADLQDPPEEIPTFLGYLWQGYDVVYAQRVRRKESLWLRASYFVFYRLLARLSRIKLPLDVGDFGLMSRRVVEELKRTRERQRYLRGLRTWVGFRQIGVPIERGPRSTGTSKYTPLKLLGLAFDGIFAFSVVPLRAAAVLGGCAILASSAFALYSLYAKFVLDRAPVGFTALILVITFLSGVNLFFVGVIGEYVGRVYEEVKARPTYVLAKLVRGDMTSQETSGRTVSDPANPSAKPAASA